MHLHLEEALQRDIETLRAKVVDMARLTERALKASLQALVQGDRRLAYSVILRDQYIDELETQLDRLCLEFLVRQQPAGGHLRFVFTIIKINKEIERIGDYAESIARQVLVLGSASPQLSYVRFIELGDLSVQALHDAVQAFLEQDAALARKTMALEEQGNALRNAINKDLAALHKEGRLSAESLAALMTVARRLERVTDQAKNFCEEVLYLCTGEFIRHPGAEAFRILFLDAHNACLSQMAEALGNAMGVSRFVFSSAGIVPESVDLRMSEFMAAKGLDLSKQTTKNLQAVPHWDSYQVMVALDRQGVEAFPIHPTKTVCFTWEVRDPSQAKGSPEVREAAFESAYASLKSHIQELVEAICGESEQKSP